MKNGKINSIEEEEEDIFRQCFQASVRLRERVKRVRNVRSVCLGV